MTRGGEPLRRAVALDTSVLINFLHLKRLDLLFALPGFDFAVPEHVEEEVTYPEQKRALTAVLEAGRLRRERIVDPDEIASYAEFSRLMGRGEAACLALAEKRGWHIASDERGRFQRLSRERIGEDRILNTPGVLILAIREGLLDVEEADSFKKQLEAQHFTMVFRSFRDVLDW